MKKFLHRLKSAAPSLIAYWLLTFYGLATFCTVILLIEPAGETLIILGQFVIVTILGQVIGHVAAYLRPRLWVIAIMMSMSCFAQILMAPLLTAAPWFAVFWFFLPFTLISGFLAIRSRTEIFGAWIPLMYSVSACLVLLNNDADKLQAWRAGNKFAVWDVLMIGILSGALLLFLIYLVARQSQALTLWQEAAQIPQQLDNAAKQRLKPRARVSWLTWFVIAALAVVLTIGTALVAPFLFRTADSQKNNKDKGGQHQGNKNPKKGKGKGKGQGKQGKKPQKKKPGDNMKPPDVDWDRVGEGVKKAAEKGANLLMLLLIFLFGVLLVYFVFWRPLRRVSVLRHLERPAWPVPATTRIRDLWRRTTIALADLGIETRDSETVEGVARRANQELSERYGHPPAGLEEAAAIYSRVQYNLGVSMEDQARMAAAVELLTEYSEDQQAWWQQVRNLYRGF